MNLFNMSLYEIIVSVMIIVFFGKKLIIHISCKKYYGRKFKSCSCRLCNEKFTCMYSKYYDIRMNKKRAAK